MAHPDNYFHPHSFRAICNLCVIFALILQKNKKLVPLLYEANGLAFCNKNPACCKQTNHISFAFTLSDSVCATFFGIVQKINSRLINLGPCWTYSTYGRIMMQSNYALKPFFHTDDCVSTVNICNFRSFDATMLTTSTPNHPVRV